MIRRYTRSSRPHTMPTKTSAEVEQQVLAARTEHRDGPDVLGPRIGVPARTVSRILRRHGMPYLRDLDRITGAVIRSSRQTAVRYERDRPGELVHMDVKKLGKIPKGGGWKAHGRQMGSTAARKQARIGYDCVHSLIDDHSRLAYSEILPDDGIPPIERLMTDNAWAYRWSLRTVCANHDITQKFIKPHCPGQNGKVERLSRTLTTEGAYRQVFTSNDERAAALAPWLEH